MKVIEFSKILVIGFETVVLEETAEAVLAY